MPPFLPLVPAPLNPSSSMLSELPSKRGQQKHISMDRLPIKMTQAVAKKGLSSRHQKGPGFLQIGQLLCKKYLSNEFYFITCYMSTEHSDDICAPNTAVLN